MQVSGRAFAVPDIRWLLDTDGDGVRNDVDDDDDGDTLIDSLDPHPYDFEIFPKNQSFTVSKNSVTRLTLDYPKTEILCGPSITAATINGSLSLAVGGVNYQPNTDYVGEDQFQFVLECSLPNTKSYVSAPFLVSIAVTN